MTEQQDTVSGEVPADVVTFWESVPLFRMLEFIGFPEERWTPAQWMDEQADLLSTDPASTPRRTLAPLPSGEMLVFDLTEHAEGYPLSVCELGFPEDAVGIGLTIVEYLGLATELAPLEAQMLEGVYPFEAIVSAFERRGLQDNEYWSEHLATLAETRSETEQRLREAF